jgi:hypothetical protein
MPHEFLIKKPARKRRLVRDLGIDARIILK